MRGNYEELNLSVVNPSFMKRVVNFFKRLFFGKEEEEFFYEEGYDDERKIVNPLITQKLMEQPITHERTKASIERENVERKEVEKVEVNEDEFSKNLEEIKRKLAEEIEEEVETEEKTEEKQEEKKGFFKKFEKKENQKNIPPEKEPEEKEETDDKINTLKEKLENGEIKAHELSLDEIKQVKMRYEEEKEQYTKDINKLVRILQHYKEKIKKLKEKIRAK